jgi:hypothetical protein
MFSFQYFWVWQQAGKRGRKSNTEYPKVRFQTAEYGLVIRHVFFHNTALEDKLSEISMR